MTLAEARSLLRLPQLGGTCCGQRHAVTLRPSFPRVFALLTGQLGQNNRSCTAPDLLDSFAGYRHYATAQAPVSRPKAHTGRTPASKKKAPAVDKAAPIKTVAVESPALVKVTAKKPAAKKLAAKKTATGKAKPKPNTKPKAKSKAKPKAKPKAKSKRKKVVKRKPRTVSDRQIKLRAAKTKRAKMVELQKTALKPPGTLPETAWIVMALEQKQKTKSSDPMPLKEASALYKDLILEEREHYNHIGNQNKLTNRANYQKWILNHTPDEIRLANKARRILRKLTKTPWRELKDERQVKRPALPYSFFVTERYASEDFKGIRVPDAAKRIAIEWKETPESEKKRYYDLGKQARLRYIEEMKSVYNIDPKTVKRTIEST